MTRAVIVGNRRITGLLAEVIAELVAEVGPLLHERHRVRLESRPRQRAVGAGAKHRLVFIDRLLATLVHLRHGATHDVLACWFGVDRSTITRAIGEVRPLLATRGCTIAAAVRLRTLAEVIVSGVGDVAAGQPGRCAAGLCCERSANASS
ncbi:transposase family protein [Streptomyces sp. NPDC019396]|uniref:helix-turn-helix domain-containing protein n=1 Tax=Streptomyces sp. NPDC019396 TaxID=3154687 RepID=UPI0033F578AF